MKLRRHSPPPRRWHRRDNPNNPAPANLSFYAQYDKLGNLCRKYQLGLFGQYGYPGRAGCGLAGLGGSADALSTRSAHQATSQFVPGLVSLSIQFDARGSETLAGGMRGYEYSALNQPLEVYRLVSEGSSTKALRARFSYGPDGARYRRVDSGTLAGGTTTTTTIGLVERRELPGNVIEWRRRIGSIAIVEYHQEYVVAGITQVGVAGGTRHQFNDRLGTPQVIASVGASGASGASVTVHERLDTAADGEWRSPDPPFGQAGGSQRTSRGFTGHEHLEGHGVIHMTWIAGAIPNDRRSARRARAMDGPSSGRLYWQSGGRMVQADPIVTEPLNPQSWNPYSYVLNNPLNLTDPSGYSFIGKYWRTIASIAISIYAPYAAPWLGLTSAQAAIAGGFVAGAVQTNSLKGGVYGAFSAGMFNKIGTAFQGMSTTAGAAGTVGQTGLTAGQFTAKVVAHGMAGGVMSSLQGGKFGHGFASAGFSEAASPIVTARGGTISQGTAVAVIGGTASAMTGGKFANGAVTAAFGYAFGRVVRRGMMRVGNGSQAYRNGLPQPDAPNAEELGFVRGVASDFEAYGSIEHCALICRDTVDVGPTYYALSDVHTDGSQFGCDPSGLSCPSGTTAVSDIHNHPRNGTYRMSRADVLLLNEGAVGDSVRVRHSRSFSMSDLQGNLYDQRNGWVVPSGSNELLYFPKTMQYPVHNVYDRR